ncbi:exodeoxyribonuclease V subunit gamma [Methylococcus sp. EFPC2]|uniref:exodeoxyribonuclease V subunit gamma n=1 Tax=Methylococcus sp. EFPC2 TaxID=2812648 RepID=UPI001967F1AF|nr:exodeoxyribonuclease V subunit gamma [Methylococcus sp. EFPC2]QSA97708.1 exodeoxyribonuclease V subunit gamma [Methylococcus sp. EFPC2]
MLILHHGNRLENLADELAQLLAEEPAPPLQAEVVITQSRGMARWLALRLADRLGVAAHVRFPLPGAFIWEIFERHIGGASDVYQRDVLVWRIYDRLPELLPQAAFAPLRHYLADPGDELRRYRLARQIADVFDQYQLYRGSLLLAWEAGEDSGDWQAPLWRALVQKTGDAPHRARLFQRLANLAPQPGLLPPRLSVFGLSSLPPAYLEVLEWLGEVCDIHVFLPNPCRQYWGDIEDRRTLERWLAHRPDRALHQEIGHPLLASQGKQGRDFIRLIYAANRELDEREHFVEPGDDSLLRLVQGDILDLRENEPAPAELLNDDSIRFHACHGAMREVQVLHDQLLALLEANPALKPGDIVVMTPAIERYAPLVEAVFAVRERGGREGGTGPRLPCAIADRAARREHTLLDVFPRLLELPESRLDAAAVFELLATPAVAARFELNGDDLETLRRWIAETGIRWGLDGKDKQAWKIPADDLHTWRFGLDRMLMGYALAPETELCRDIAPYPDVEGQQAEALGRLVRFIDRLEEFRHRLAAKRSVAQWIEELHALREAFFRPGEEEDAALPILLDALDALNQISASAEFAGEIGRAVIADFLQGHLDEPHQATGFLTGRITFCSLMPMRSIPFEVVCLLGMNDQDYPRRRYTPGFDLIARDPQPGDRSRREDDRYLFLEALLSARSRLYISYAGRSQRDNSELQPSVLVSELQELIAERLDLPFEADGKDRIGQLRELGFIVEHPLQPFSPRYFSGVEPHLFSYAPLWAERGAAYAPFVSGALAEPPDSALLDIDLESLIRFFRNPAAHFLRHRLDLRYDDETEVLETSEPFALDPLTRYALTGESVAKRLVDAYDEAEALRLHKARGDLPQGVFGELGYRSLEAEAGDFAERLRPLMPPTFESTPPVTLRVGDLTFSARAMRIGPTGLFGYRVGRLRPQDRLEFWLQHLVAQLACEGREPCRSLFVSRDTLLAFPPLEPKSARIHLVELLGLYRSGLDAPAAFFPQSSYAYADAINRKRTEKEAVAAAYKLWEGDPYNDRQGEGENLATALAFRGRDPFSGATLTEFKTLALTVYDPLLSASSP